MYKHWFDSLQIFCLCVTVKIVDVFYWKLAGLFKANKNMTVITNVEHKEQKESLPFVNKTNNQVFRHSSIETVVNQRKSQVDKDF